MSLKDKEDLNDEVILSYQFDKIVHVTSLLRLALKILLEFCADYWLKKVLTPAAWYTHCSLKTRSCTWEKLTTGGSGEVSGLTLSFKQRPIYDDNLNQDFNSSYPLLLISSIQAVFKVTLKSQISFLFRLFLSSFLFLQLRPGNWIH